MDLEDPEELPEAAPTADSDAGTGRRLTFALPLRATQRSVRARQRASAAPPKGSERKPTEKASGTIAMRGRGRGMCRGRGRGRGRGGGGSGCTAAVRERYGATGGGTGPTRAEPATPAARSPAMDDGDDAALPRPGKEETGADVKGRPQPATRDLPFAAPPSRTVARPRKRTVRAEDNESGTVEQKGAKKKARRDGARGKGTDEERSPTSGDAEKGKRKEKPDAKGKTESDAPREAKRKQRRRRGRLFADDGRPRVVVAFDIGTRHLAHARVRLENADAEDPRDLDVEIEHAEVCDIVTEAGSGVRNSTRLPAHALAGFTTEHLLARRDALFATRPDAVVIEVQPGSKMRNVAVAVQCFCELHYRLAPEGVGPGDRAAPPILQQTGTQKLRVLVGPDADRAAAELRARPPADEVSDHERRAENKLLAQRQFEKLMRHYPRCARWQPVYRRLQREDKGDDMADAVLHALFTLTVGSTKLPRGHPGFIVLPGRRVLGRAEEGEAGGDPPRPGVSSVRSVSALDGLFACEDGGRSTTTAVDRYGENADGTTARADRDGRARGLDRLATRGDAAAEQLIDLTVPESVVPVAAAFRRIQDEYVPA